MNGQNVRLLIGAEHSCGYLPGLRARSAFVDTNFPLNPARYGQLLDQGFRRSGGFVYRPLCQQCAACKPARVAVAGFKPSRSQRRCLAANSDLTHTISTALSREHFALYQRYLRARHADAGMDPEDEEAFREFLSCPWGETEFWEFRLHSDLLAVTVVDRLPRGLSAVYCFFAPEQAARSLGSYAIIQQILHASRDGLPYVYLGYWVPGSAKMAYKRNFRPLEVLGASGWVDNAIA